jgi:hypothetical protein
MVLPDALLSAILNGKEKDEISASAASRRQRSRRMTNPGEPTSLGSQQGQGGATTTVGG